jgi:predicted GNAT family acetyltransferase
MQPCFQFYDIPKYLQSPHVILDKPLENTPYFNETNVKTFTFEEINSYQLNEVIWLIQKHFLREKKNIYSPDLSQNFLPYFECHPQNSFISLYYKERILLDKANSLCKTDSKHLVGTITSTIMNVKLPKRINIKAFYVDFLCVDKRQRKQGIAEQLIQTHERNQRLKQKQSTNVSLFKREGELTFIVPLCVYKSYVKTNRPDDNDLFIEFFIKESSLRDFIVLFEEDVQQKFPCIIHSSYETLQTLMTTKNVYIVNLYSIDNEEEILAVYIFKDSCTDIATNNRILICTGSICTKFLPVSDFKKGFELALKYVIDGNQGKFKTVVIENISDNYHLIDLQHDIFFHHMAYFFYNYVHPTIQPHQLLVL